ncbi:MAG: hypothetical protein C4308_02715 [Chitinophagaceae bacterium]
MASHGKSRVVDQVYEGKRAPNGKIVYIDKNDRIYWIDDRGRKIYISKKELIDKPVKKEDE